MRVLVGCEFSGKVRDAFIKSGHDAISCDLRPTESKGPHYQGDLFDIIEDGFDLGIFHPECTYLANSGVRHLHSDLTRWEKMVDAARFFRDIYNSSIPHIAIENPIMHKYGKAIIGRGQNQVIQPWMFGHPEKKATCLWLKNLPNLQPTKDVREQMQALPKSAQNRIHYMSPSKDRQKLRSITYDGIAQAFADQWGNLTANERA